MINSTDVFDPKFSRRPPNVIDTEAHTSTDIQDNPISRLARNALGVGRVAAGATYYGGLMLDTHIVYPAAGVSLAACVALGVDMIIHPHSE